EKNDEADQLARSGGFGHPRRSHPGVWPGVQSHAAATAKPAAAAATIPLPAIPPTTALPANAPAREGAGCPKARRRPAKVAPATPPGRAATPLRIQGGRQ